MEFYCAVPCTFMANCFLRLDLLMVVAFRARTVTLLTFGVSTPQPGRPERRGSIPAGFSLLQNIQSGVGTSHSVRTAYLFFGRKAAGTCG